MSHVSTNPPWRDYPSRETLISAHALENIEDTLDAAAADADAAVTLAQSAQADAAQSAADAEQAAAVAFGTRDDTVSYLVADSSSKTSAALTAGFVSRGDLSGLLPWQVAYNGRDTAPARVAVVGHNEGRGAATGSGRWMQVMRDRLDGPGARFYPVAGTSGLARDVTLTGNVDTSDPLTGPGFAGRVASLKGASETLAAGQVEVPAQRLTHVRVWFYSTDFFGADATLLVDDAVVATIPGTGADAMQSFDWTAPTSTTPRTVAVRSAAGSESAGFRLAAIEVFDGGRDSGVHLIDATREGTSIRDLAGGSVWPNVAAATPDLVVAWVGDHDFLTNAIAFIEGPVADLVDQFRAQVPYPSSLLLVLPPRPVTATYDTDGWLYAHLHSLLAAQPADDPHRVAFLDLGAYWPTLEPGGATNLGLMVETIIPRTLSPAGHQFAGAILADLLS